VADTLISNDEELIEAFQRLEGVFQAEPGTSVAAEREALVQQIEAYENEHYPIPEQG
tara:strand:+ start:705 stop:875 length:171 start_codon:yes stop_codon:yes gene_type:complete